MKLCKVYGIIIICFFTNDYYGGKRGYMPNFKVFIGKDRDEKVLLDQYGEVRYLYEPSDKLLKVTWNENVINFEAKQGDGFIVIINPLVCDFRVKKIGVPKKLSDFLMWTMSYEKKLRTSSIEDLKDILRVQRAHYVYNEYTEYSCKGEKYLLILSNKENPQKLRHNVAYIDDSISNEEAIKLLNEYGNIKKIYYPFEFVKKALKEEFSFSDEELSKLNEESFMS